MDYAKLYKKFILSRREIEGNFIEGDYFESHHIFPRSLGGDNSPENLIKLSPEDHYFAHLLLAKIHGGWMWYPLFLMARRSSRCEIYKKRIMYGTARRKLAELERGKEGKRGSDNGNYNSQIYHWYNKDTKEEKHSTLFDMWAEYGGTRGIWTSASTENSKKPTALGWCLFENRGKNTRSAKGKTFDFINRDGREFTGTQSGFMKEFGINAASAHRVCKQSSVTTCGWRLKGVDDRPHNTPKGTGRGVNYGKGDTYVFEKNGKIYSGNINFFSEFCGEPKQRIHAAMSIWKQGRVSQYKGHRIIEIIPGEMRKDGK